MAPSPSNAPATSVQVAVRIRPATAQDSTSIPARFQRTIIHPASQTTVAVDASATAPQTAGPAASASTSTSSVTATKKQNFTFDQVHAPAATQYEIFTSTALPLISRFVEGFNCTILAYGQTSSGKTFTMTGIDLDADPSDPNNGLGIIPRAVSTIFARARQLKVERANAWNWNIKGSFIEIYNEDLIDLLSLDDASGGRREVQIREDKDGTIIWGGLREVNVKTTSEVMNLLRKGTAIRRTNETEMNAQSSRSHAIFSLTLTQKKFIGSGPPPRSSSPAPTQGRSPSRLARPGSMFAAAGSSSGRPSTPAFASAMGRGGLRPSSALGMRSHESRDSIDDEAGEWVTVVSKFHFVDLAGSERLKRTAAVGERIKEGISINSGLLALGNVISALGDPSRAKSHTNSHVPYRDSKLTRLLQDSLGGNAHTLMIACVSPAEWNVGETINTLKYANRARNIKNRAVVNEREDGWDDIEWLQGNVTRLRKELKLLKEGGAGSIIPHREQDLVVESSSKKMLAQMTELQNNYEDLRGKFVERTEELTRLRRELGHKHRASSGAMGGTAKYEEIVGPVIEEYEKTIAAMEAELSLNRAALRMTNEMVEEKEDELSAINERHAATELYVDELRSRVAKLGEREASTEAYVRDLEEKIKAYDESSLTSRESMTDLKREVARFRDSESYSGQYIVELEARLARSDESVITLQRTVEKLEKESERREEEVAILQTRLDNITRDGDSWRTDLEERERKVLALEAKMEEWERKKREAGDSRLRLNTMVDEVAQARKSLEVLAPNGTQSQSASGVSTPANRADLELESQLIALQQTHTATLADLSNVTAKYRDALREISDLAAQIQEAKLNNSISTVPPSPALEIMEIPSHKRRMPSRSSSHRDLVEPQLNAAGRRLFFREAASAESLHTKSLSHSQSQSLSQELSSARLRKNSFSSHGTSSPISHSPSRSVSSPRTNLSANSPLTPTTSVPSYGERSVSSLEKEIMRLQEVLKEREAEITMLEESVKEMAREQLPRSDYTSSSPESPLVNGTPLNNMILSPKMALNFSEVQKSMEKRHFAVDNGAPDGDDSLARLNELMLSMAQKESQHRETVDELNSQLSLVRRQHEDLTVLSRDQAINMSAELGALRTKYSDDLAQLEQVQLHEEELLQSIERAEAEHTAEIESLRTQHEAALRSKSAELDQILTKMKDEHEAVVGDLRSQLSAASATLEKLHEEHQEAFGSLQEEHDAKLRCQLQEANDLLERTRQEHESAVTRIHAEHEEFTKQKDAESNSVLQRTEEDYYNALTKLRSDHAKTLQTQAAESSASIERLKEDHLAQLRMAEITRQGLLSESESSRNIAIQELQDEHTAAISRKEAAFVDEIERLVADHQRAITTKEEDIALALEKLRSEHEGVIARLREESRVEIERLNSSLRTAQEDAKVTTKKLVGEKEASIQKLKDKHALAVQNIQRQHLALIKESQDAHATSSKEAEARAEQERTNLSQTHAEELEALKRSHELVLQDASAKSEDLIAEISQTYSEEIAKLKSSHDLALQEARTVAENTHTSSLQLHTAELEKLKATHQLAVQQVEANSAELQSSLVQSHTAEKAKLETQHQQVLAENDSILAAAEQKHREELEATRLDVEEQLNHERARGAVALADLEKMHSQERDTLWKDHHSLARELEILKSTVKDLNTARDKAFAANGKVLAEKSAVISSLEKKMAVFDIDRSKLTADLAQVKADLATSVKEQSRLREESSRRELLTDELEKQCLELAETRESLQRLRDEKDILQTEKNKRDSLIKELQAQLAHSTAEPSRTGPDRSIYARAAAAMKFPPPTPPPHGPPPPAPHGVRASSHLNGDAGLSVSSFTSTGVTSSSSRDSQMDSPATSTGHGLPVSPSGPQTDPKLIARLEEQVKQIEEQSIMIKTLNKQLTHCETDLQANIDLVAKLESSALDSEKNLRKARAHATELARERDALTGQVNSLRNELSRAQSEVATVRRSIAEEKQSLEHRLDEERRAKERVRAQLDSRMEELQKRKSKFACL